MASLVTDLPGKTVIVTGASSGIGKYAAIEFAKNGAKICITGRKKDALEETKQICINEGKIKEEDIHLVIASLEDVEECKRVVSETISKFGKLDVLVNSAGILVGGSIETLSLEDYDKQMNINTRSLFVISQAAVPHLKETKGNIVNISSVTGSRSFPGVLSYCMSKAAVDQMTRCVALELAPYGVRVNAVNPGVIVTNCHKNAGMNDEDYAKFLEKSKETHALGRAGNADEVAKSIVFLASNNLSGFMTGVTLPIDGGRGVMCPR
jgi:NAD(P)-dependent dehydrogenase (short-subunit alcohol dehydrogenase family)